MIQCHHQPVVVEARLRVLQKAPVEPHRAIAKRGDRAAQRPLISYHHEAPQQRVVLPHIGQGEG
jgi:hypothetical protein